jgi:predicted ATPase
MDIGIHNFRSFQNQNFNFSRINILIGENSGGKSSFLKFLLALKQTVDRPLESNLKLTGDYVDLGNYEEVVYGKKKSENIIFSFEDFCYEYFDFFLNVAEQNYFFEYNTDDVNDFLENMKLRESKMTISFELTSKLDSHYSIATIIENENIGKLKIIQNESGEDRFGDLQCSLEFVSKDTKFTIAKTYAFKEGFFTLISPDLRNSINKKFRKNSYKHFFKLAYLLLFQNFIKRYIDKIRFVNPIGTKPKRFYFREDKKAVFNQIDIEKFINILGDDSLSQKDRKLRLKFMNDVIRKFGIAEEIDLVKEQKLPVLALKVKTKEFWSNITDVGYGVSLQIPILFQAILSEFFTEYGNTILIEQPEVHLHPSLQSKFIDTLLSLGEKNNYFIETHSEHIIRMLQVIVKAKRYGITNEDISIHYFRRTKEQFLITQHRLMPDGKLEEPFPSGFYDASYSLVKELL